jgi:uncharacterized protein (TIGR00299 family) protein
VTNELKQNAGLDKILFVDAFSGVAGDMLVAALLDLGVPQAVFEEALKLLPLAGYSIEVQQVKKSSIAACRFIVNVEPSQPQRNYAEIQSMLHASTLTEGAKSIALKAFDILARAEARVHRMPIDKVHFHEVGAVDSIVDIVAAAVGLNWLGARVISSPLPMGRGSVITQHGALPLPAPATVECLHNVPTYDAGIDAELVTPTGACLIAAVAETFSRWPQMRPHSTGWGSGSMDLEDRPNLLRLVLGDDSSNSTATSGQADDINSPFAVLEANIDDMSPEIAAYAIECMLNAGALDAWTTPILMKKGRQAIMLSALVKTADTTALSTVVFRETTSLGVRIRPSYRSERARRMINVATEFGPIPVKVAEGDGLPQNVAPEFDDCRRAAEQHSVPIKAVFAAATAAAESLLSG